jgi:DNA-binding MarR family transcriptional regulator
VATAVKQTAAAEAWGLLQELFMSQKPRLVAIAQEFELAPQQLVALKLLGEPVPMSELAAKIGCDSSNVTGITDRLEQRGLVERRGADYDRRVKLLVLTDDGRRTRDALVERMSQPPELLASLPAADQKALRDILRRIASRA